MGRGATEAAAAAEAKAEPPLPPPRASSGSLRRAWPPWSTRRAPGTASRRPTACPGSAREEEEEEDDWEEEAEKAGKEETFPEEPLTEKSTSACASRRPRRHSAFPAPGPCQACPAWPRSRAFWNREKGFDEFEEWKKRERESKGKKSKN